MQNNQAPVPANIPQYVYPEDEISLIDLWLVIVRHKIAFWIAFGVVVAVGMLAALVMPTKYSVTSAINIGQTTQRDEVILLESPETVKAKLESALVPKVLNQYVDDEINRIKFDISIPKKGQLVVLKNKVQEDAVEQTIMIHNQIINELENNHDRILAPIRAGIEATIQRTKLKLAQLEDQRFYEPTIKSMETKLNVANAELIKLENPIIQGHKLKSLQLKLDKEKDNLSSLEEQGEVIKAKKARLDKISDLLVAQVDDLKKQISHSLELQQASVVETKSGTQAMAMLMIENEIQQNRNRLSSLEERLYVGLENQHSELQREINDNKRKQIYQKGVIEEKTNVLEKYQLELKLDMEKQKMSIAELKADQTKLPAEREQEIKATKQELTILQKNLSNVINTNAVTTPARSPEPSSIPKEFILAISVLLGIMLGLFSTFLAEFRTKVQSHQQESRL